MCTLNSQIIAHAQQRFGYLRRSQAVLVILASERAKVPGINTFSLPDGSATRVTFMFAPGALDVAEISLSLRAPDEAPLSPVWLHR